MAWKGTGSLFKLSLYIDNRRKINPKFTVSTGIHYDYIAKSTENTVAPRLQLAYTWNDHMSVSAEYGLYYQSPRAFMLDIYNDTRSARAENYGIGVRHQVGNEIAVSLEFYNKNLTQLILIDANGMLSNEGYGYSRGAEFFIQMQPSRTFYGWISYTYSISKRKEGIGPALHPFDFDRPHLLSLVTNYLFAEHWQVWIRFRYGSGRPFTGVESPFYDAILERWVPIPGEHNSGRYPAYHRLDLRATRKFKFENYTMDVYIEFLNTYNQNNIAHYMWDETYSSRDFMIVFPFLPVLGISARF